jgi:hypothetical protein
MMVMMSPPLPVRSQEFYWELSFNRFWPQLLITELITEEREQFEQFEQLGPEMSEFNFNIRTRRKGQINPMRTMKTENTTHHQHSTTTTEHITLEQADWPSHSMYEVHEKN